MEQLLKIGICCCNVSRGTEIDIKNIYGSVIKEILHNFLELSRSVEELYQDEYRSETHGYSKPRYLFQRR